MDNGDASPLLTFAPKLSSAARSGLIADEDDVAGVGIGTDVDVGVGDGMGRDAALNGACSENEDDEIVALAGCGFTTGVSDARLGSVNGRDVLATTLGCCCGIEPPNA